MPTAIQLKVNGDTVQRCIERAISSANANETKVWFHFNGIRFMVKPGQTQDAVYEWYADQLAEKDKGGGR